MCARALPNNGGNHQRTQTDLGPIEPLASIDERRRRATRLFTLVIEPKLYVEMSADQPKAVCWRWDTGYGSRSPRKTILQLGITLTNRNSQ